MTMWKTCDIIKHTDSDISKAVFLVSVFLFCCPYCQ